MVMGVMVGVVLMGGAAGQSRLREQPGYERYEKMRREVPGSWKSGAVGVTWVDGGVALEYERGGKRWRYGIEGKEKVEVGGVAGRGVSDGLAGVDFGKEAREWRERPERGRQFPSVNSPDGTMVAYHRDRNVYISASAGNETTAVTKDASDRNRVRYGTASWVYGEEFYQKSAMWWSGSGRMLAFYRFDEKEVPDFYLTRDHTALQTRLEVEPYTKAGAPNPRVDLMVYDLESRRTVTVDVRSGQPFSDDVTGHYVLSVVWSPDGRELLFHRMDRRQKVLECCAADPDTGKVRVVYREERSESWVDPETASLRFLRDGRRFLRETERSGWRNIVRYDLGGGEPVEITKHGFETAGIVRVDEAAGVIWYLARSGDHPMKVQLHRCGLDGTGDVRLTDPGYHHSVDIAPDGKHFADTAQTHSEPPVTRLMDAGGVVVEELAASDLTKWNELGLRRLERFTFKAADGETDLYGLLHFPSNFDPAKKWPLLVSVYAGPSTNGSRETFGAPSTVTEAGWLVATMDSRSAAGRGKRFLDAIYQKLGQVEIDDQAAGVKALAARPYVDGRRVGIHGTSYGGTASVMALLRHPETFQAACASSGVMDFRNYDSIYTERYLGLPRDSGGAYDAASPLLLASALKGRLMIFFGTADNNVHPGNSLQLIKALQDAGKSFEVQVGPDQGHVSVNQERMLEFFGESLGAMPK